jgi:hypothetical protein
MDNDYRNNNLDSSPITQKEGSNNDGYDENDNNNAKPLAKLLVVDGVRYPISSKFSS